VGKLEEAVSVGLNNVTTQLTNLQHDFATKVELNAMKVEGEKAHAAILLEVSDVDKKVDNLNKKRWLQNTLSAIFGSILTFLLLYFLNTIGH
jgi:hypothetical protein